MKILLITEVCRRCVNCPVFAIGVNRYGPGGRVLLKNFTVFGRISGADFDLCETFRKRGSVHWLLYTPCKDSFDWITKVGTLRYFEEEYGLFESEFRFGYFVLTVCNKRCNIGNRYSVAYSVIGTNNRNIQNEVHLHI